MQNLFDHHIVEFRLNELQLRKSKLYKKCYQMVDKYGSEADKTDDGYLKYIAKHGFGPEAHEDTEDGTKNTKMIV